MPLWIKLDVTSDGKVWAWQSENNMTYQPSTIFGYSPREALLKLADTMQRRPRNAKDTDK